MSDIFEMLAAPFDPSEVDWRMGSMTKDKKRTMALCYIDARTVMDRLDTVCGPQGWQNRYVMEGTKTVCEIGIKCGDEWVWKADGAGDSDIEAEKGALSDAFKRSAVRWGIGRYLYTLESPWVDVEEGKFGRPEFTAEAKRVLNELLRKKLSQSAAKPEPKKPEQVPLKKLMTETEAEQFANDFAGLVAKAKTNAEIDELGRRERKYITDLQENHWPLYESLQAIVKSTRSKLPTREAAE